MRVRAHIGPTPAGVSCSFVGIGGFEKQHVRFLKVLEELMKICEAKSATCKVGALSSEM